MPTALTDLPTPTDAPRKRWTRREFDELYDKLDGERLELIEGDLVSKMGKNRPHVIALRRLQGWLSATFGAARVNPEAPINVSPQDNVLNEPEPDLIVLTHDDTEFLDTPNPADLLLVVEIAESTLHSDLTTKAWLYARAGIIEYWVVDLIGRRLIVHREPVEGRYRSVAQYAREESVAPVAAPDSKLYIQDIVF